MIGIVAKSINGVQIDSDNAWKAAINKDDVMPTYS
jgi:hypothetical protein